MLLIIICTKGNQALASSGGVTFFWCLCCLATTFNVGYASVFTAWPERRCRARKLPTAPRCTLPTACMARSPAPDSRVSFATSTGCFPSAPRPLLPDRLPPIVACWNLRSMVRAGTQDTLRSLDAQRGYYATYARSH